MWSRSEVSNRGCVSQRLDFSELLALLDFLSDSPLPVGLEVSKHVSITAGWHSVAGGLAIRQSVVALVSALPPRLADPSIRWEGLSILQRMVPPSESSVPFGNRGAVGGEVMALILSTSRPEPSPRSPLTL